MTQTTQDRSSLLRLLPVAIFVLVAGFFAIALRSGDPSRLPSTMIGKVVPPSNFPALEGLQVDGKSIPGFTNTDLADGKVKVVNFWASWCAECVNEHPLLEDLKTTGGIGLYGVAYKDQDEAARRFLGRYGNPFDAVGTDFTGRTGIDWGVYGMPESFIVDGKGTIVYKQVGPMTPEIIKSKILPAIEAAKSGQPASKG
jgi:cytochrome c biogenesis protein CcmG/thiol:disulfide interchange protein DsbE